MIDLHTHTYESDGTSSPQELIEAAVAIRLDALGISDHDTFAGYDAAVPLAASAGLELVCGIELSTKLNVDPQRKGRSVHILGYFLDAPPARGFREWLAQLQRSRRDRNRRLALRLQALGMDVTLAEVERLGHSLAGRPHFARLLLDKGYVATLQEAFDRYLAEDAEAYVEREEPSVAEGIGRIVKAGGLASLAHPVRLFPGDPQALDKVVAGQYDMGLRGIEVYHSDHSPRDVEFYLTLARRYGLAITGGTDFHGANKPAIRLGTGIGGNVHIERELLDNLRALAIRR
jgi:hypothetical protein